MILLVKISVTLFILFALSGFTYYLIKPSDYKLTREQKKMWQSFYIVVIGLLIGFLVSTSIWALMELWRI